MKPFSGVEKNRIAYHKDGNKNTVHRSSLIVPRFNQAVSNISFLNHFLIKRNNKDVTLKVTAINSHGTIAGSLSIVIDEPKVYSFDLESLFEGEPSINQYLVEFYSNKNLFIPFPAVMVNHIGNDFTNSVHSYNRVLNDVFENDTVNKHQVCESLIDVTIDENHDTFLNFVTGPFAVKDKMQLSLVNKKSNLTKDLPVEMARMSNKNFYLSDIVEGQSLKSTENLILKVLQPKQDLFYGRLLSGRINKKTSSFSANHSYYDSSSTEEYSDNAVSMRSYPYFSNCLNRVTMYPIMSPSLLNVFIEVYEGNSVFKSEAQIIKSPSDSLITFDVDRIVSDSGFTNVTLFKVIATSIDGNIPTRVSHQLVYGEKKSHSKLYCTIAISLHNEQTYTPANKTGLTWGQVLIDHNYYTRLGICFDSNSGDKEEVSIDFYGKSGLLKSLKQELSPAASLIFDDEFFASFDIEREFIWFVAKSISAKLQADSFHTHRLSHNSSGEHSF